ncbi:MAG TPA: hypothetical protein VGI60_04395 [Chthoniobacterales bacterium]|jgi:hypothetical protein
MNRRIIISLIIAVFPPVFASAAGLPPWQFGMSKSQVASFRESGPYKSFSNGDLETYNGRFEGKKENIQFFFRGDRLRRIGIYLFEGKDLKKGVPLFQLAYDYLQRNYGKVIVPELSVAPGSEPLNSFVIALGAAANAAVTGRTEMHPAKQPKEMRISAEFMASNSREGSSYAVAIFLNPKA